MTTGFNGNPASYVQSGFSNLVILTSTQNWTVPAGVTKAEITVQAAGGSSATSTSVPSNGGSGGGTAIKVITVIPGTNCLATIGAGGIGPNALTNLSSNSGGSSSFAGSGFTTLSATGGGTNPGIGTSGDLNISGGAPYQSSGGTQAGFGGSSFLCGINSAAGLSYGGGAGGVTTNAAGVNGFAGVIIIKY